MQYIHKNSTFLITSNVHRESIHLTLDWMC